MSADFAIGFNDQERELNIAQLSVQGSVPEWLRGVLLRNGPSKFDLAHDSYRHWFDGMAMLQRFEFNQGTIAYRNRMLRSRSYEHAMQTGKIGYLEFASSPHYAWWQRLLNVFGPPKFSDNAAVNVAEIDGHMVALTESVHPIEFDPVSLAAHDRFEFQDELRGMLTTAHPLYDYARRESINYMVEFSRVSHYHFYRLADGSRCREPICSIPVKRPAYMHSFGMTQNYIILTEFPMTVNPLALRFQLKPFIQNYRWQPQQGTRIHIISKQGGSIVATHETDAMFAFHHINAYEEGGNIVMDIVAHDNAEVIDSFYLGNLRNPSGRVMRHGRFRRYTIPLSSNTSPSYDTLGDDFVEFPMLNHGQVGTRSYRYFYSTGLSQQESQDFLNKLVKIDLQKQTSLTWSEAGCYPGEPIFVARPDARDEDQGVILSLVLDSKRELSFLLILDAGDFTELARADLPVAMPFGFHGNFYAR